jgi:hypothetical protein
MLERLCFERMRDPLYTKTPKYVEDLDTQHSAKEDLIGIHATAEEVAGTKLTISFPYVNRPCLREQAILILAACTVGDQKPAVMIDRVWPTE